MKKFFCYCYWTALAIFPGSVVFGQTTHIAKPNIEIDDESIEARRLSDIAFSFRETNADSAFHYAKLALASARKVGDKKIVAYSLSDIGSYYKFQMQFDSASRYFEESLRIRIQSGDKIDIASVYNQLGMLQHSQQNYRKAVQLFDQGLQVLSQGLNPSMQAKLQSGKGLALFRSGKQDSGLMELERSIRILEIEGDSLAVANSLQNLGNLYRESGQYKRAASLYERAHLIYQKLNLVHPLAQVKFNQANVLQMTGKLQQAKVLYEEAKTIAERSGFLELLPIIYNNLGMIFLREGKLETAEQNYSKYLEISHRTGQPQSVIIAAQHLAEVRIQQRNFTGALLLLREAADSLQGKKWPSLSEKNFDYLSDAYAGMGDYSAAFRMKQRATDLSDSLDMAMFRVRELSDEIEINRMERERMEREAVLRTAELEAEKAQNRAKTFAIVAVSSILGLSLLIIFVWQYQRLRKLRAEKQLGEVREISLQKDKEIMRLTRDSERSILQTRLETMNRERKRIARDLHDRLGSGLAVVQIHFDAIQPHLEVFPEKARHSFEKAGKLLEEACDTVRDVAHNIERGELSKNGLATAIDNFCREISAASSSQVVLSFSAYDLPSRLPDQLESEIFSMVRTLIENILRHASAKSGTIQMFKDRDVIRITVEDDGSGFEPVPESLSDGMGLRNVRERCAILCGNMQVDSSLGKGTFVSIEIPFEE